MKKLILIFIIGIFLMSFVSFVHAETFTPIFCNDYEFTCCREKSESANNYHITDEIPWTCPTYASRCNILYNGNQEFWVGSGNCGLDTGIIVDWYACSNENKGSMRMNPGDKVYLRSTFNTELNIQVEIMRPNLIFCGRSGCEQGISVSGADGCKFNPINNIVYTSTSSLTGKNQVTSYTVPLTDCVLAFQSGDRHICGYKEESCSSDTDCSGHTYGNKECSGRKLQTYGCRDYGTSFSEKDRGPFDGGWGNDKTRPSQSGSADFGKRCEIINAQDVQCCGDTDCGTNYFCERNTFTCKEKVECTKDYDCGVSEQCDPTSLKIKKPVCNSGKCSFNERGIGCCSDNDCEQGKYCDTDKICKERYVLHDCPYGKCCIAMTDNAIYRTRECSDGLICCTNAGQVGDCKQSCEPVKTTSETNTPIISNSGSLTGAAIGSSGKFNLNYLWMGLGILLVIGIIAGTFVMSKRNLPVTTTQSLSGERCSSCNQINKKGTKHCIGCGKKISDEPSGVKCSNCGSSNNITKKFCTNCGSRL